MGLIKDSDMVDKLKNSYIPFVAMMGLFVLMALRIIAPLAPALAWAAVLSFFTYPIYSFLLNRVFHGRFSYLAAAINTVVVLVLMVLPMIMTGLAITRELGRLYIFFSSHFYDARDILQRGIQNFPPLEWLFTLYPELFKLPVWGNLFSNMTGILASFMTDTSKELLGNFFKIAFNLLVITVASFFITHDGPVFLKFLKEILPLPRESRDAFFSRSKRMLRAVFYGIMLTAAVQGTLGALGWWYVGLDNPVLFGTLMFFFAMIPFVGTPVVWVPGSIYLFMCGDKSWMILFAWGLLVVSSIDNFIKPYFISEGSKAHILLVFIGILGGLSTWGFLGLFMGPLVLSIAYFLLDLYRLLISIPDAAVREAAEGDQPPGAPAGEGEAGSS